MATQGLVRELTEEQSWERLRSQELGRIVTHVRDVIDIFPINYVVDDGGIVFRTAEGSKLIELTVNDAVLFEIDAHTDDDAWSVVVRGRARTLEGSDEIEAADRLPLHPWVPTVKRNYVRIDVDELSGRSFLRSPEPDHDAPEEPATA